MKKIFCILFIFLTTGCYSTTWNCAYEQCEPYYMVSNRCLAQANSAFSENRSTIWEQCMKGHGFMERECMENENTENPCVLWGRHAF